MVGYNAAILTVDDRYILERLQEIEIELKEKDDNSFWHNKLIAERDLLSKEIKLRNAGCSFRNCGLRLDTGVCKTIGMACASAAIGESVTACQERRFDYLNTRGVL